ncbi:GMC oxidoreductase [Roridomyces roridus]|uniref:GMC oxidoreductase n=1 Tax=Roridomyces roridus TaxID=1738132 RepID=A0AAD7C0W8_9AGAR|nr:GMC oxidoreductase [Roridomyces roridus]
MDLPIPEREFDFVVIGGGTAGLAVASRLTEDSAVHVVVLEAGQAHLGDPKISRPEQVTQTFGDPQYDWLFKTEKQPFSGDNEYTWSRGKGLGGSSAMNYFCWTKPPAADVDAIEKLGNPGWNWDEYMKYSMRSETFHPPATDDPDAPGLSFEPKFRGKDGPIHSSIAFPYNDIDELTQQTLVNKGLRRLKDPYGGDITGVSTASSNVNPSDYTRSYAATGYFESARDRPNLVVLTEAMVSRVLFSEKTGEEGKTATSVEYIHEGRTCLVHIRAQGEVILSAGAIQSPKILELSGIGRPEVLAAIGVDMKIQLDGVGENVQEHTSMDVSFELARSFPSTAKPPSGPGITAFAYLPLTAATSNASALIDLAVEQVQTRCLGSLAPGLKEQLDLQLDALRDDTTPDFEVVAFPGFKSPVSTPDPAKRYFTMVTVLNHPFSRGTIHAKSADPLDHPSIDPRYFENDFDLELHVQHIKYIRGLAATEPMKSAIVREVDPGPEYISDEDIREYIKKYHWTTWHTIGSCSMLPKEKNGVVDPELKVYGTTNLRVVDLSVIPLHIAAHTQTTVYMIAEKAVDIIRGNRT